MVRPTLKINRKIIEIKAEKEKKRSYIGSSILWYRKET